MNSSAHFPPRRARPSAPPPTVTDMKLTGIINLSFFFFFLLNTELRSFSHVIENYSSHDM